MIIMIIMMSILIHLYHHHHHYLKREPSYVYNTYDNDNDEWVYPTAPPVPSNIPTVVHAIPLNTYEAVPELPISNVRRHRQHHRQQQQQQQQSLPRYQQQQSPPINNISDDEEEELPSDDEAFVYDNSVEVDEVLVEQLVEMGFDRVSSKNELNRCRNQIDIAIARLVRFNEKHSRNIRVIEKPKPSSSSAGASSSSKTNTKPNTFLRKVIGVPKKVPISINLFGTRKILIEMMIVIDNVSDDHKVMKCARTILYTYLQ